MLSTFEALLLKSSRKLTSAFHVALINKILNNCILNAYLPQNKKNALRDYD